MFPQYLRERFESTAYAYLSDIARLEWAYQESLIAPDGPRFEPTVLQAVPPERCSGIRFELQPHCRLVRTRYPVIRIWRANQPRADEREMIDLGSSADLVIVCREGGSVVFAALSAGEFALLEALQGGRPLGQALDSALKVDGTLDVGLALRRYVSLGALARVLVTGVGGYKS